jgi:hypothetical protein
MDRILLQTQLSCIRCGESFRGGHRVVVHAIRDIKLRNILPSVFTAELCKQCYLSFPQDIIYDYEDHTVTYKIKCTGPRNYIRFQAYNNHELCFVQIVNAYGMHEAMKGG